MVTSVIIWNNGYEHRRWVHMILICISLFEGGRGYWCLCLLEGGRISLGVEAERTRLCWVDELIVDYVCFYCALFIAIFGEATGVCVIEMEEWSLMFNVFVGLGNRAETFRPRQFSSCCVGTFRLRIVISCFGCDCFGNQSIKQSLIFRRFDNLRKVVTFATFELNKRKVSHDWLLVCCCCISL